MPEEARRGPQKLRSERTTNSRRKMTGNVASSHALAVSARSLAVGDSEIYALLLNNG